MIQSADTVVFVISPAAVTSERCAWEVKQAEALSKRIIPIVALPVTEAETPHGLKRLNYIFFTEGNSFSGSLGELAKALRIDLDWIREHTRLGELAARWQSRSKPQELLLRGSELQGAQAWLARWKAPAPEPSDLQRDFIGASEMGERAVLETERRQLELTSQALAEKDARIAEGRRRLGQAWMVTVLILGVAIISGVAGVWSFRQALLQREYAYQLAEQLEQTTSQFEQLQAQTQASDTDRDRALAAIRSETARIRASAEEAPTCNPVTGVCTRD